MAKKEIQCLSLLIPLRGHITIKGNVTPSRTSPEVGLQAAPQAGQGQGPLVGVRARPARVATAVQKMSKAKRIGLVWGPTGWVVLLPSSCHRTSICGKPGWFSTYTVIAISSEK